MLERTFVITERLLLARVTLTDADELSRYMPSRRFALVRRDALVTGARCQVG